MEKDDFIKLLQLATEGMFLYRDKLYRQIDGVAMGSPLGPTLANFFQHSTLKLKPAFGEKAATLV